MFILCRQYSSTKAYIYNYHTNTELIPLAREITKHNSQCVRELKICCVSTKIQYERNMTLLNCRCATVDNLTDQVFIIVKLYIMARKKLLRVILYLNNSKIALPPRFNISIVEFQLSSSFTLRLSDKFYNHCSSIN